MQTTRDTEKELREAFRGQFMQPEISLGKYIGEAWIDEGGERHDFEPDGYHGRLSAAGYLDCTDWIGPFDTVTECAEHLVDTFGE